MSSRAQKIKPREQRPVFQDLSRRRWTGFLTFAGSASGTLMFLGVMLWLSISSTPQLTPLRPLATSTAVPQSDALLASASPADPIVTPAERPSPAAPAAAATLAATPLAPPPTATAPAPAPIVVADLQAPPVPAIRSETTDPTVTGSTLQPEPLPPRTYADSASIITLGAPRHGNSLLYLDQARQ